MPPARSQILRQSADYPLLLGVEFGAYGHSGVVAPHVM